MASFGENLQRERELRGISLEEIAAATRISTRILRAIEAGEVSKLPSGVYARSFVRQYARYLGLDPERVMAEYLLASPSRADVDMGRMSFTKPPPPAENTRASLLALLLAAVMLGTGYLVYLRTRRGPESPVPAPKAAPSAPAAGPAVAAPATGGAPATPASASTGPPAQPAAAPGAASAPAAVAAVDASKPPAAEGELTLQVTATEKSWVGVEADGKPVFERILKPTEVETVKARESFDLIAGNAAGIVLTLNGQTLSPLGGRGVTKRVHLTRDDLKNPAP